MSRSALFKMRISPAKLASWRDAAAADGKTLSRFVELAVDDAIAVAWIIARNEQREQEQARRLHSMDPAEARRLDWGRTGELGEHEEGS